MGRPEWKCDNCGCCCRLVGLAHPDMARDGSTVCRHLHGNRCSIYKDRPYFCNVIESYDRDFSYMSFDEFEKAQRTMCRAVRKMLRSVEKK